MHPALNNPSVSLSAASSPCTGEPPEILIINASLFYNIIFKSTPSGVLFYCFSAHFYAIISKNTPPQPRVDKNRAEVGGVWGDFSVKSSHNKTSASGHAHIIDGRKNAFFCPVPTEANL